MANTATPMPATVPSPVLRLWERRAAFAPFAVSGALSVVAGGVVAAATAHSPTEHGIWTVAYLILVLGVSQFTLGTGLAVLPAGQPATRLVAATVTVFNIANMAVILGTVTDRDVVLNAGAALLIAALGLFLFGVRHGATRGWPLQTYRLVVAVLAVSTPVGLLLATTGSR